MNHKQYAALDNLQDQKIVKDFKNINPVPPIIAIAFFFFCSRQKNVNLGISYDIWFFA